MMAWRISGSNNQHEIEGRPAAKARRPIIVAAKAKRKSDGA